jgi:FKBP-type peptidyl-prolyl cis-trans isomerase FklB
MKKSFLAIIFVIALIINATAQDTVKVALKSAPDSLSFSFGLLIGNNLFVQKVDDINSKVFLKGFNYGYSDQKTTITIEEANRIVQEYFQKLVSDESTMNLEKSNAYMAENQSKEGVVTLPSGLQYKIITPGTGDSPKPEDQVKVHYTGTLIDGKVFDSSIERNEPVVFGVNQVIPGWTEALQLMQPGARWMLYIPPALAYGENGAGGVIGPNQALIFEVELIEIVK